MAMQRIEARVNTVNPTYFAIFCNTLALPFPVPSEEHYCLELPIGIGSMSSLKTLESGMNIKREQKFSLVTWISGTTPKKPKVNLKKNMHLTFNKLQKLLLSL